MVLIKKWDAWGLPTGGPALDSQLNTWLTGSGSLALSNTTSTVAFFVKVGGGAGNNVFFDNLTFTPEPAGLILLLLGLPMLLRRR
jgi:ethanolamine utilization protein EutA (predicted chaperonin)